MPGLPSPQNEPFLETDCQEIEGWDYARNRQIMLKSPAGEFSASVYSVPFWAGGREYIGPNRDSAYQGLLVSRGMEVCKVLDGIFFSKEGSTPGKVMVSASRAEYTYGGQGNFSAGFSFGKNGLQVKLDSRRSVLPLMDMRTMGTVANAGDYSSSVNGNWIAVSRGNISASIGPFERIEPLGDEVEWVYKLGSGFRHADGSGNIRFSKEMGKLFAPAIGTAGPGTIEVRVDGAAGWESSGAQDCSWMEKVTPVSAQYKNEIMLRFASLRSFGLGVNGGWFPEAGCWWFRAPWVRDALEGIITNFVTYTEVFGWMDRIKRLAALLLKEFSKTGGLPNYLGGQVASADSPPLLVYLCSLLGGNFSDVGARCAALALAAMRNAEVPGIAMKDGLVLCAPFLSWTDSRAGPEMRPTRLPDGWGSPKEWEEARYALPEVNALWISALNSIKGIAKGAAAEIINRSLDELSGRFKGVFWNGSTVANIADVAVGRTDWTPTSMGAVAVAVAPQLFTDREVEGAFSSWKVAGRRLMTLGKEMLPFGIAITPSEDPYLGDWQYHKSVVWPRDTPYLINILQRLGREADISAILVNNLDHMVSEGALLYSSEIFGFPTGGDAQAQSPRPADVGLIPLKNPAQYWSHWCDPYIGRFVEVR